VALLFLLVALTALVGVASLAVDWGHVQLVKSELQRAADAAARSAAIDVAMLQTASVRNDALASVRLNPVDGAVLPDTAVDVELVQWDATTRTYQRNVTPGNAVMVTVYRTADRGNPVPMMFAGLIGKRTCDVKASTIVAGSAISPLGFQGLNGVTFKNNAFLGSYDPTVNTAPTQSSASSNAVLGSNSLISSAMNTTVRGDVMLGTGGSTTGSISETGSVKQLGYTIPLPWVPSWRPRANPGGLPKSYTVSSNTVLPGGTYWFVSLTISANLSFSGPATVIVNGDVVLDAALTAYNKIPANLTIYQLGTGRTFGDSAINNLDITARIIAPGSDFSSRNNGTFRGAGVFNTITIKNNWDFYYDETLGKAIGGQHVEQVR
jgi:hypothetical protein